jgi:molybdopterin molybdotransferase
VRPFKSTITLAEAQRRLEEAVRRIERVETIPLSDAAGRVVAADVVSAIDVPAFARASMDGYAVIAADTTAASADSPARLRLVDRIYTGHPSQATIRPGTTAEIGTGAPLPAGSDAVVMVENTVVDGSDVLIKAAAVPGANVGRRAADIASGDLVARAGDLLTPARVGALAATGQPAVCVFARPRIAILSTGNEVVDPGRALSPGQVYDVNRFTLTAIAKSHGGDPLSHTAARDSLESLGEALDACAGSDLVVFSGGSSVGARDLIVDLVAARGTMIFHGIAIKPGKPTGFAIVDGMPFFAMPGNPTSCLSNAYILLIPFLRSMARLPPYQPRTTSLPVATRIISNAGRHQFYAVRIRDNRVFPAFKGSGDITSLSEADGFIELAADQGTVEAGEMVTVTLF